MPKTTKNVVFGVVNLVNNVPVHLPSNQSMGEGELRRKRLGKEIDLEPRMEHTMREVDSRFRVGA